MGMQRIRRRAMVHREIAIELDGPEKLILSGALLELVASRRMPDDLKIADEPEDPIELEDDDLDEVDLQEFSVEEAE